MNPIRAAVAKTPETSAHTSVKARIERRDTHLAPFADRAKTSSSVIPMNQDEYLRLVDWTGRELRLKKRGRIPESAPPILQRLDIDNRQWLREMQYYGRWYYRAVGSVQALERYCQHLGQQWLKGTPKLVTPAA